MYIVQHVWCIPARHNIPPLWCPVNLPLYNYIFAQAISHERNTFLPKVMPSKLLHSENFIQNSIQKSHTTFHSKVIFLFIPDPC